MTISASMLECPPGNDNRQSTYSVPYSPIGIEKPSISIAFYARLPSKSPNSIIIDIGLNSMYNWCRWCRGRSQARSWTATATRRARRPRSPRRRPPRTRRTPPTPRTRRTRRTRRPPTGRARRKHTPTLGALYQHFIHLFKVRPKIKRQHAAWPGNNCAAL